MVSLGVNIDHIATLRNARGGVEPDVIQGAIIAEKAGADAITAHLREDRRHIKDKDIELLKKTLKTRLNLEMAATEEMQKIAIKILPYSVTLVPEKRQELTTEGGLDVANQIEYLKKYIKPIQKKGIMVSLFIDADENQVIASKEIGAEYIELHTGAYAEAFGTDKEEKEFLQLKNSANLANNIGLKVNAGHGLNYQNTNKILEIDNLVELNIGHTIISKAVMIGLDMAVKEIKAIISK
ncbi:MAG: pyridoxine 5'-phosphate synthase [Candidatus Gastranaerophilales bacterium]|nr:pyridoxine 5'-phosphate synthase [Candidatus Gastranaerophilales bacterium]